MFLWKNVYIKRTSRFLDQPVSFIKVNESQYKQCGVTHTFQSIEKDIEKK